MLIIQMPTSSQSTLVVYDPCQTINKAFPRQLMMKTVKQQVDRPLSYSKVCDITGLLHHVTSHQGRK